MGKLVRDRIPDIMRAAGKEPDIRVLDNSAYLASLFDKLNEEAGELREAEPEHRIDEAADVYEVLLALAAACGFTLRQLEETARRKRAERGAFRDRIWLERW